MGKIAINIATGNIQQTETIVGIDLGTTNSLIAFVKAEDGKRVPFVLKEIDQSNLVPSVVYINNENEIIVGIDAIPFLKTDAQNGIHSVKSLIGKNLNEISNLSNTIERDGNKDEIKIILGKQSYTPIEISSFILKELKHRAEHILKTPVSKAVITVPAYFNDTQRQATREAGQFAGLDVLRIVNEPTAAALAYGLGLKSEEEKTIAVYDFGGGTFDVSILKIENGIFEVLSTSGDTHLGGDDMDSLIVAHWLKNFNPNNITNELKQQLRIKAEEAKKTLTENENYKTNFNNINLEINRVDFEKLIEPLVSKTIHCCKNAIKDSGLKSAEIEVIVMVGGTTRVPLVKKEVSHFFNKDVFDSLNPDEVVALGAALQADILAGNNSEMLLLDITSLSLGIETMGGLMDVLIPRNSKIPTQIKRQYTTSKDGQTGIAITVYQGERDLVKDNRKLASFILNDIPAMPAGFPKVDISFMIDADGILNVRAKELRSGVTQTIVIKPQSGINDEQVEKMLLDSYSNAENDKAERALTEAITEAQQLIAVTEKFLNKHENEIENLEKDETQKLILLLQKAMNNKVNKEIVLLTEKINAQSRPYAERVMNSAINTAMKGTKIL